MKDLVTTLRKLVFGLCLLAVVLWRDRVTGYEVSVLPLYAVPIGYVAYQLGLGWGLFASALSFGCWFWANRPGEPADREAWITWERSSMAGVVLVIFALAVARAKRVLAREQSKLQQLEGILAICMVCHRIRDKDGRWIDLNDYLHIHTAAETEQRVCPQCSGAQALTDYAQ